jgi:succinate dehydrogenase / fumarate reductase iron-sulfur subunit
MAHDNITVNLFVWRQAGPNDKNAGIKAYKNLEIDTHMSFLEMLDVLNAHIIDNKEKYPEGPVAFEHDCREGICGACSLVINGRPHGPLQGTTTCQLHMRNFKDGADIYIEPFKAKAFPIIKDLATNRSAFDKIIQAGGYVSVNTGGTPDGNAIPIAQNVSSESMDAAACIGCGACVAACPNAAAMLFTSAKVSHLALLPQGKAEAAVRVKRMVTQMDKEGFGLCSNVGACEAECPKEISLDHIARMNREYISSSFTTTE